MMWYQKMIMAGVAAACSVCVLARADVTIQRGEETDQNIIKISKITLEKTAEKKVSLHIVDDEKKIRFTLSMSNAEMKDLAKELTARLDYRKEAVLDTKHPFYRSVAGDQQLKIHSLSVSECRTYQLDQVAEQKDLHAKVYFCYLGTSDQARFIIDNLQLAFGTDKTIYLLLLLTDKDAQSLIKTIEKRT